jgi:hypothetical protein
MQLPWFYAVDHLPGNESATRVVGDGALSGVYGAIPTRWQDGRNCLATTNASSFDRTIPATARVVTGMRVHIGGSADTGYDLLRLTSASTTVSLQSNNLNPRYLVVRIGSTNHTTTVPLVALTWQYWELDVLADATAGSVTLRIDGVEVLSLTGLNTGTDAFTRVRWSALQFTVYNHFTDLYIREAPAEGSPFYGPILLRYLKPVEPDVQAQWTPNGGASNANRVNQVHDGDTTYIETQTLGNEDIYDLEDLPPDVNSVIAVVPITTAVAPAGGAPQVEMGLETSAGTVYTQPRTVGVSVYQTQAGRAQVEKPGGGGWSIAAVNELKLRLKAS